MNSIEKLVEMFRQFPGIGPRQARRFVYFLLGRDSSFIKSLTSLISDLKASVFECVKCHRFFTSTARGKKDRCNICEDPNRDYSILMIVSRDADLEIVEKSNSYRGLFFVLGGSLLILEKEPEKRIRIKELVSCIEDKDSKVSEIILALNANPEGEHTAEYVVSVIAPLAKEKNIKISYLGRGISTGTELEYADSDTIKNALKNRA